MFETCRAGAAAANAKETGLDMNNVVNRFTKKSNVTFFGAAQGAELAHFDPRWKNRGAFTQAIVEGLSGAAKTKDGFITINSLSERPNFRRCSRAYVRRGCQRSDSAGTVARCFLPQARQRHGLPA
jgi:hypothetical protein